jgi:long-subunit acyl-CoA synthetase (AMP-forming)
MPETSLQLGYPAAETQTVGIAGIASIPEAFQATVRRFPDAIAYRTLDDSVRLTWAGVAEQVARWATALSGAGVGPGGTVAIMMVNRPEQLIVDLAAIHLGAAATSVYNTMPPGELAYVLDDSGARVLVTESAFLDRIGLAVLEHGLELDRLVILDAATAPALTGVQVAIADDFLMLEPAPGFEFSSAWQAVTLEDICHVIYTSGTTGPPKGVELSHRSALWGTEVFRIAAPVAPGRRLLSAFPLAHAAERAITYYIPVVQGHCVTFCPDIRQLSAYYLAVRPAYVFMTPRSLERFKAVIERNIALEVDSGRRAAMQRAITVGAEVFSAEQERRAVTRELREEWEATADVRREILAMIGLDQVEYAGIGSAPVSLELMSFFSGLGMPCREGWGMTETGATTAIGRLEEPYRVGYCGSASPGMEVKVADDGEILVRGEGLMTGYRNKPAETEAIMDADGWLRTGDIGAINELGQLKMVDRKKELIITTNGKNMSPVKIESKVKNAGDLVGQIVAVGDSKPHIGALLQLDPEGLEVYRARNGIAADVPVEVLAKDEDLLSAVQAQIDRANADLADVEQIRDWAIITDDWIPGGDELTPTMKLKRRVIVRKYADAIDELYR